MRGVSFRDKLAILYLEWARNKKIDSNNRKKKKRNKRVKRGETQIWKYQNPGS